MYEVSRRLEIQRYRQFTESDIQKQEIKAASDRVNNQLSMTIEDLLAQALRTRQQHVEQVSGLLQRMEKQKEEFQEAMQTQERKI